MTPDDLLPTQRERRASSSSPTSLPEKLEVSVKSFLRRHSLPSTDSFLPPSPPFYLSPAFRRIGFIISFLLTFLFFLRSSPLTGPSEAALFTSARGPTKIGRAILGKDTSLTEFIDFHFPLSGRPRSLLFGRRRKPPHVWLTMADVDWIDTGAAALHEFVLQLNKERRVDQRGDRDTVLVTMCLDEVCVERCVARGMFCYGGFMYNRPEQMLPSTWPKVAGLIEILGSRDVFFVDSDVFFKMDPYPHMEPLMKEFDVVAQENDAYDHLNTGWIWFRNIPQVVDAWKEVLAMDMRETSRDQFNFNTVLETTKNRLWQDSELRPLRSNFTTANGLRIHVLDDELFRSYHFERDRLSAPRAEAVYLHTTCADDLPLKFYIPKSLGFGSDVDGFYTSSPQILTVSHLAGSTDDLIQRVKILVAASHYSGRAFEPPAYVTFTDMKPAPEELDIPLSPVRRSYAAFPFAQMTGVLQTTILESDYTTHAISHLLGVSTLGPNRPRVDKSKLSAKAIANVMELQNVFDFDMRQANSFPDLITKLTSTKLANARSVRLINFELPGGNWRDWELPQAVAGIKPCERVDMMPACGQICRGDAEGVRIKMEADWLELSDVMSM